MSESTPLLNRQVHRKATAWHVIIPFTAIAFVAGAIAAPVVELFALVFCHKYYKSEADDIPVQNCAIPEVQALASKSQGLFLFIIYALGLLTASRYGRLSDQKGRLFVFKIAITGACVMMMCYILTFTYTEFFGSRLLFIGAVIYGACGGESLIAATVQAYIADSTPPDDRSSMFSRLIAFCSVGSAIGSSMASYVISATGSYKYILWAAFSCCFSFLVYTLFFMPESHMSRESNEPVKKSNSLEQLNVLSSLRVLRSSKNKHVHPYALILGAVVDFMIAFVTFPPLILYAIYKFGWTSYEGSIYNTISNIVRLITTSIILPYLSTQFHKLYVQKEQNSTHIVPEVVKAVPIATNNPVEVTDEEDEEKTAAKSLIFDIWMIRTSFVFETLYLLIFASTSSSNGLMVAGAIRGFASVGTPAICSFMSKLVDSSKIGEMTSALSIIEAIASMMSQLSLPYIYGASVGFMPELVFYVCAGVTSFAFVIAMFIYYKKDTDSEVEQEA